MKYAPKSLLKLLNEREQERLSELLSAALEAKPADTMHRELHALRDALERLTELADRQSASTSACVRVRRSAM